MERRLSRQDCTGLREVVSPPAWRFKPGCEIQFEFRDIQLNPVAKGKTLGSHISL